MTMPIERSSKPTDKMPATVVWLYILGWLLLIAGFLGVGIALLAAAATSVNEVLLKLSLSGLGSAILVFGFAAGLFKLYLIEEYLRPKEKEIGGGAIVRGGIVLKEGHD